VPRRPGGLPHHCLQNSVRRNHMATKLKHVPAQASCAFVS
jgi:hypothetical protein